jgi:hypothetical protein
MDFQTLPAMPAVIVSVVAGAIGAVVVVSLGSTSSVALVLAAGSFILSVLGLAWWSRQSFSAFVRHIQTRFPSSGKQSES